MSSNVLPGSELIVEKDLVDLAVLGPWMDAQGLPGDAFENQRLLTGGTQNILLYFERGGRAFVLRRPPRHLRANSSKVMMREARVLKALRGSGVPHPGYIAQCEDETLLGAAFFLMEPVEGFNPIEGLPEPHRSNPDLRRRMGEAHVEALAKLGSLDYRALGLEDFGRPQGYLQRQPGRWAAQLQSYAGLNGYKSAGLPFQDEIYRWLEDNIPGDFKPGVIHGDCHMGNTLFSPTSGELAALIDWELSTIGDPLLDLGWVMATCPWAHEHGGLDIRPSDGFPSIAELIAHYRAHSDRDLSSLQWYAVLACYKLGAILEGTYARACAGRADNSIGDDLHKMTLALFRRGHRWIQGGIPTMN